MSNSARESIYEAIASIRLIDPHTHINPHAPASNTLADLLGYHYYTELAHSAGMPKDAIEEAGLPPRELVHRLVSHLSPIENTAQYRWLVEICRMFFGFDGDRIDLSNWEQVYDSAERQMQLADWPQMVLDQSNVEAVFLTNDFDDELSGFDSDTYIPCLRTDDLVFNLAKLETRQRLAACSGIELNGSLSSLRESLEQRFEHFVDNGARACAISLPPTFQPTPISDGRAETALNEVLRKGPLAEPSHQAALSRRVFWTLAELCDQYGLPFDLMIGVNRGVYENGVYQGQDLYDSRVSLIQYRELFNSFPAVKFPISVLASVTNQELVSYAWIFPNVITNGHWWYSNTPSFIARDAAARLEAVPQTKQIAYYSDAYKLEFVWPKFDMYRRILSGILADQFVQGCGWSEERAVELGRQVLRDNVDEIFPRPFRSDSPTAAVTLEDTWSEDHPEVIPPANWSDAAATGSSAALAAGAIGMVEVNDSVNDSVEFSDEPMSTPSFDDHNDDESYSTVIELESVVEPQSMASTDEADQATEQQVKQEHDDEAGENVENTETLVESLQVSDAGDGPVELDPLPSDEEIQAVDVGDVELSEFEPGTGAPDADAIEAEADSDPINVGDLLGDDEPQEALSPEIRMLRGEESFEPDEDSLQLKADPATGELTFPVPSSDVDDADVFFEATDDADVLAESADDADVLSQANDDWLSEELELDSDDSGPGDHTLTQGTGEESIDNGEDAMNSDEESNPLIDGPFSDDLDDANADEKLNLDEALEFDEHASTDLPDDDPEGSSNRHL